ncbi:MAG: hypothetical protein M1834_000162 [Cirrosporium novae-zelandiae]|nr:MAG: hypothetical protein M1834_000162 [Cirrosporium novae-zelandiae]
MAHKHNRRRSRQKKNSITFLLTPSQYGISAANPLVDYPPSPPRANSSSKLTAKHPYQRYQSLPDQRPKQQRGVDALEAEQQRIFGGEPGDDVGLCRRMLDYFDTLDYIER